MDVKEIKALAEKFSPEQIEGCITEQIDTGTNVCLRNQATESVINELAKAQFIRELTDNGVSLADALRELARRIRAIQKHSDSE